jgi:hypothetical protein
MSWKTEISLRNNREEDVMCVIPKGQVFENKTIGSHIQNVVASREYRLIVPADSRITVEIDVLCINRTFSPPRGMPGNITLFRIDKEFATQDDLWTVMSNPIL